MKTKLLGIVVILLAVFLTAIPALADAPGTGTVSEGVSVPGVALGDTRTEVETSYGPPLGCHEVNEPNELASCSFGVAGGGWLSVGYAGPNGGDATRSPDDVVHNIRWGARKSNG